ncbi:helix-turn-helix domain-containing protein [Sphingobacterium siyangense]|uniref:helix-turn-helix domain-containing protein n=1 Tax=Sphingobacterium siyangense TaxID=459529 RepID=UPI0031F8A490
MISLKNGIGGKMYYGQQEFDFDNGLMAFMEPNQIFRIQPDPNSTEKRSGWMLLIHPDFLWNTSLSKNIKHYDYFDYSVSEALFLSDKEEQTLNTIIEHIKQEYHANIDKFSKNIIVSHVEALLNYAERFYHRQFLTREKANHQILEQLEDLLDTYFAQEITENGLPSVQFVAEKLNVSSSYLGNLLRVLTGQYTQQYIHEKLIYVAKEKLSTTNLSISEIAYGLGFEHSQAFSRLFKSKTSQSPVEFRSKFN